MDFTKMLAKRTSTLKPSFIREILKAANDTNTVSFAGGLPNPHVFPVGALQAAANEVLALENKGEALQYTITEGYIPLRAWIAHRYNQRHGIKLDHENILITTGSQQALDIICKGFLDPGDRILCEQPAYLGALQLFDLFQAQTTMTRLTTSGIDLQQLDDGLKSRKHKLAYLIPNFQNPTGYRYDTTNRKSVAKMLQQNNTLLIEDDPYGELFFNEQDLAPISKYLGDGAILLGSYSKVLAPGLRLGWIAASKPIIKLLTSIKQRTDLHSSHVDQRIIHNYLVNNNFENHLSHIRKKYKESKDMMIGCIKQFAHGHLSYHDPDGGMFLWAKLKQHNARWLFEQSSAKGVFFVPGETFSPDPAYQSCLRLNFSNASESDMERGIKILGNLLKGFPSKPVKR